jgi:hypothetical protein
MQKNYESDPYVINDTCVVKTTRKALLVRSRELAGPEMWIPKSVIHADSEIDPDECKPGDEGMLVIEEWFAKTEGLIDEDIKELDFDHWS